ncbi:unnamed protein product, partial [Discosporangium mesarthrocarpum]
MPFFDYDPSDAQAPSVMRQRQLYQEIFNFPGRYDFPAESTVEAVQRGLNFILQLVHDPANFADFGSDAMLFFSDLATVAREPLRKFVFPRVGLLAQRWKQRYQKLADVLQGSRVEATDVVDAVVGVYALERVGATHPLKMETKKFIQGSNYSSHDYFGGFDPRSQCPSVLEPAISRHRVLTHAMTTALYAERVGLELGATQEEVLAHLPKVRPYLESPNQCELGGKDWVDQITLVINIIHIASNFGELRVSPSLVPEESKVVMAEETLDTALKGRDVHLIGHLCHCMRILGVEGDNPRLRKGISFLVNQQLLDGSWVGRENADDPYTRYHAAMCAVVCLHSPEFRGFGPINPSLAELLGKTGSPTDGNSNALKMCSCGIEVVPLQKPNNW